MTALRTLAHLFTTVETETASGGRTVALEPAGDLWIALERPLRSGRNSASEPGVTTERALAETRSDPRLEAGMRVEITGRTWRLTHVDPDTPRIGRMTLTLVRNP